MVLPGTPTHVALLAHRNVCAGWVADQRSGPESGRARSGHTIQHNSETKPVNFTAASRGQPHLHVFECGGRIDPPVQDESGRRIVVARGCGAKRKVPQVEQPQRRRRPLQKVRSTISICGGSVARRRDAERKVLLFSKGPSAGAQRCGRTGQGFREHHAQLSLSAFE